MAIDQHFKRARQAGIDVNQVGESWAHHLSEARRKVRDNPQLAPREPEADSLTVIATRTGRGVKWETLGTLAHEIPSITVEANSLEAAKQRESVESLLERRYKREYALALVRVGVFQADLDGMRAAMRRAMHSKVHVADVFG